MKKSFNGDSSDMGGLPFQRSGIHTPSSGTGRSIAETARLCKGKQVTLDNQACYDTMTSTPVVVDHRKSFMSRWDGIERVRGSWWEWRGSWWLEHDGVLPWHKHWAGEHIPGTSPAGIAGRLQSCFSAEHIWS